MKYEDWIKYEQARLQKKPKTFHIPYIRPKKQTVKLPRYILIRKPSKWVHPPFP